MTNIEEDDPPPIEAMNIHVELYDKFSLATLDARPGSCGTGDTPVLAIKDLIESLDHEHRELLGTPAEQCHDSLNVLREPIRKFNEGIEKKIHRSLTEFAGTWKGEMPSHRDDWHGDPEMEKIAAEATEFQILAVAARDEGWRINKDTEEWFAEKPCHNAGVEDVPDTNIWRRCYTHEEKFHCPCCCNGTLFVRAGKIKKEMEEPNAK